MSALARYYLNNGHTISWSDSHQSEITDALKAQWIQIFLVSNKDNIPQSTELVIYTEAIPSDNEELIEAKQRWIKAISYFAGLWEISSKTKCLAVCWTHWKSTTTAMIGIILKELGVNPDVIVGTLVPNFWNSNYLAGNWQYLIVEACEYRANFLHLNPFGACILNIEADHLDYYKDLQHYISAFESFIAKIPQEGFLVVNWNDKNIESILHRAKCRIIKVYDSSWVPDLIIPGKHVKFDWKLAIACCRELLDFQSALLAFKWTWRRFEIIWKFKWALVISDYGHHPTEIKATLQWIREKYGDKRIICIFEPHQYSRTIKLFDEFCKSFEDADITIIPWIYRSRDSDEDVAKISASSLANGIKNWIFLNWFTEVKKYLESCLESNDIVIFMGAWTIDEEARKIINSYDKYNC